MCKRFASSGRTSRHSQKKRQTHLRQDWVFLLSVLHLVGKSFAGFGSCFPDLRRTMVPDDDDKVRCRIS